jgi:soluble lytic murein transglycosylase-like protein
MGWLWILAAGMAAAASNAADAPAEPPPSRALSRMTAQQASIARQRVAIRQQAANLALWLIPWEDAPLPPIEPPAAACEPLADGIVAPLIESAAKANSVDRKLIRAVMEQESGLRPCAVSPKGARGLMQLMPDTAQDLQVQDPFDPGQSIEAGTRYLKQLLEKYKGDIPHALAAYNAGPNAVDAAAEIPNIPETRSYVAAILEKLGIR